MTTERRTGGWHEAWATRPARPRDGRMIAGVAAGLGRRYDVDPVLMRIAFVVTALYGPGIPLYLLGCGLLPDGGRAGRGRAGLVLSGLLVAAGVIGFWILLAVTRGGWFLPLVVTLALLVALHVTRGNRYAPAGTPAPGGTAPGGTATTALVTGPAATGAPSTGSATTGVPAGGTGAADGSPTTVVPHADPATDVVPATDATATGHVPADPAPPDRPGTGDHPTTAAAIATTGGTATGGTATPDRAADGPATEHTAVGHPPGGGIGADHGIPAGTPDWTDATAPITRVPADPPPAGAVPAPPRPRRRTSRITPLTLTVALLAAGVVGIVGLSVPGGVGPTLVPATALAVVGVGLVVGAFRHAGRWLLPFAVLLACVTWVVAAVPWAEMDGGVGMVADAPRTVGAVLPEYRRGVGDVALDLSRVDLGASPGTPPRTVRTSARIGVGSITVRVPRNADLVVHSDTGLGELYVNGQRRSGDEVALDVTDAGPDGPGGGRVELTLHAAIGSVAVNRV